MSIQSLYIFICLPYKRRIPSFCGPETLLIYHLFCWTLELCLLASPSSPAQTTVNLAEDTAIERSLILFLSFCLRLASQIFVLAFLCFKVHTLTRAPGCYFISCMRQLRSLRRLFTFAALSSLFPAEDTCVPQAEWGLSSVHPSVSALQPRSLGSKALHKRPKCWSQCEAIDIPPLPRSAPKKICSVRGEKFSNALLLPYAAWRPQEVSPLPTEPSASLARNR